MLKKIYAVVLTTLIAGNFAFAQNGVLKGKAVDEGNGEGISFANVQLEQGGNAIMKTIADIDGNFTLKPIPPGKYDLKTAAVGFQTLTVSGVIIGSDKTTYQDMKVKSMTKELPTFVVTEYTVPLIDPDTKSGKTIPREVFQAMPSKNINSVASTTAGVFQADEGKAINIRGGRENRSNGSTDPSGQTEQSIYYIDGEKVRGTIGLPQSSIEQISVITGGIPASIGDATAGIVNITTRGGLRNEYYGGVELITSQLTDAFGYNFAGANAGGPLLFAKDTSGGKHAKLGFFLSGEVVSEKDPSPSAVGVFKVKDDKLKELEQTPLTLGEAGSGLVLSSEFLRAGDLEHVKARQNVKRKSARVDGKVDFKATDNITITLGGSVDYGNYHDFVYDYSLINNKNNPQYIYNTIRTYAKFTQKIGKQRTSDDKTTSLFKNTYYTLQVGYSKYKETLQDDSHKDNVFNYGYVGKFTRFRAPTAFNLITPSTGNNYYLQSSPATDTLVTFDATNSPNPEGALYTTEYYDLIPGDPKTLTDIQQGLGMLNGDRPRSPYNLWFNTGRQYNAYHTLEKGQFRITGSFSTDMKNHALQAGFEYEKRNDRLWEINPITIWQQMRSLANKQLTQLNLADSSLYTSNYNGTGISAYTHPYLVSAPDQSQFDKSLRAQLGIGADQWIDIDSYDPNTFSVSMFSPDELITPGLIRYYGYSYDGKKIKGKSLDLDAVKAFYKEKDANGNYTRVIPSFQPVYMSGYIQDKFDIKDMKFNIGLRIDRFDANQPVLKDKYLLYEAYTVSQDTKFKHPANMGADYVVYVDDFANPTKVLGYRNGDQWYNAQGFEISDPKLVTTSNGIQPYLKYPGEKNLFDSSDVNKVLTKYSPQVNLMPRIAFAFPISDRANFFFHYDVLTQRPPSFLRFNPLQYLPSYTSTKNNPDLKPERTVDYEAGFTQVLNERKNSSLSLSAFYRNMKDMIQIINVFQAYPTTYTTYGNIDFGNVKGFTVAYDLRRAGGVQMTASYTLQFAEGTGSAAKTAANIIEFEQPNLRTTMPLDFDQRHAIVINTDYRFGSGKDYRGPSASWAKTIFENFGGNIIFRAGSGLPYSRQKNVSSGNGNGNGGRDQIIFNQNDRTSLKGKINGSNLPWQSRIDIRLDKNIPLLWKQGEGENKGKVSNLNVYIQILNVLNAQNVLNLYRYTGDAKDDGYLSAPVNQTFIDGRTDRQSFIDLYNAKLPNPSFFSIPRRIRIGVVLDF